MSGAERSWQAGPSRDGGEAGAHLSMVLAPAPPLASRPEQDPLGGRSLECRISSRSAWATECQNHRQLRSSWHWRWEVGLVWVPSPSDPGIWLASPSPVSVAVGTTRVPCEASCCSVRLTCPGTVFSTVSLSHLAHFPSLICQQPVLSLLSLR